FVVSHNYPCTFPGFGIRIPNAISLYRKGVNGTLLMMTRILKLTLCLICWTFGSLTFGQAFLLTGHVVSADDHQPIIGASVLIKGTSRGTVTDFDGNFRIQASQHEVLQVIYTGFTTFEVVLENGNPLNIELIQNKQILQDVVVVGYKREIRDNISSAISSVNAEDISKLPVLGLDQAMQGQVPGVQVTQTTGAPGDDIAVRI